MIGINNMLHLIISSKLHTHTYSIIILHSNPAKVIFLLTFQRTLIFRIIAEMAFIVTPNIQTAFKNRLGENYKYLLSPPSPKKTSDK